MSDCYTKSGTVSVWVPANRYALLEAYLDDQPLADVQRAGGQQFVARRPGKITILDTDQNKQLNLRIHRWPPPEPPAPSPDAPDEPISVDDARARMYYARRGSAVLPWLTIAKTITWLGNLEPYFARHGLTNEQADARSLRYYFLSRAGRLAEAYEIAWQPVLPDIRCYEDEVVLYRNRISAARVMGALTDAVDAYNAVRPVLRATEDSEWQIRFRRLMLDVLVRLGDHEGLEQLVQDLESLLPDTQTDLQALALADLGWAAYLREEACIDQTCRPTKLAQSSEYSRRALALMRSDDPNRTTAQTNLAMALALEQDSAAARALLVDLAPARQDPYLRPWLTLIDAQLAANDPRRRAAALPGLKRLAEKTKLPEIQWRVHLLRGVIADREGKPKAAEQAYVRAEAAGRAWLGHLEVGAATVGLRRHLDKASDNLVRLLLDQGRKSAAFDRARAARRTELANWLLASDRRRWPRAQRQRWHEALMSLRTALGQPGSDIQDALRKYRRATADVVGALSDDQSPASPPPGVGLIMVTSAGGKLHAFFRIGKRVVVETLPSTLFAANPQRIAQSALDAVAPHIDAAKEIWFLENRKTRGLSLTTLVHPLRKRPLFTTHGLALSLDLPRAGAHTRLRNALVVADLKRIQNAEAAMPTVLRAMTTSGLAPQISAASMDVRSLLRQATAVDWLHFLGHGRVDSAAWRSGLQLPGGTWLQGADLLALENAPSYAVLLACHGAGSRNRGNTRPIGVAHALLLAGAEEVIASRSLLSTDDALAFQRALYAQKGPLRHRWTSAVRSLHETKPTLVRRGLAVFVR